MAVSLFRSVTVTSRQSHQLARLVTVTYPSVLHPGGPLWAPRPQPSAKQPSGSTGSSSPVPNAGRAAGEERGRVLRYLRLYYTVTGSAPTTGKITAGAGTETVHQDTAIYPAGG